MFAGKIRASIPIALIPAPTAVGANIPQRENFILYSTAQSDEQTLMGGERVKVEIWGAFLYFCASFCIRL